MFHLTTNMTRMTQPQDISRAMTRAVEQARQTAGKSQRALSGESGVPLVTLSRKLRGMGSFTVTELAAVAEALGVSFASLALAAEQDIDVPVAP